MKDQALSPPSATREWANRILIVSLAGIACLTLFPFRFDSAFRKAAGGTPFFLGASPKHVEFWGWFLNCLLFIPYGFGLSAQLRKRGTNWAVRLCVALAAGAFTSYLVEFLQFYIPSRNSGWDDIPPNTAGAVAGSLLFLLLGEYICTRLTSLESELEAWLSLRRALIVIAAYLGIWFVISIPLQRMTRLGNWDPSLPLVVGNDGTARHAWRGQIYRLQIWDRAFRKELALKLTAGEVRPAQDVGLLASYQFTGLPPFQDRQKTLPALAWISSTPPPWDAKSLDLDGSSWLRSVEPVASLSAKLMETNQFAVRVVCAPAGVADLDQRIVSISSPSGPPNLTLRREGSNLVFWFRTPLSARREQLTWMVRGVFAPGKVRDLLVSYDGSDASLYVNGEKIPGGLHLSPGAGLVHLFTRLRANELDTLLVLYDSLIFFPAGVLLGLMARGWTTLGYLRKLLLTMVFLLPSLLFELLLVEVSGREVSIWQAGLCLVETFLGAWLMNADRHLGRGLRIPWSAWIKKRSDARNGEPDEVAVP
jgi:VanZ family protein